MATRDVLAKQGETVDQIADRCYDGNTGVTVDILAANPGLAALGPRLPHGTRVTLPDARQGATAVTSLWD